MSWFAANTCGHRRRDVSAGVHHRSECVWIWMVQRWYGATHTCATTRVQAGCSQAGGSLMLAARMRAANAPRVPLTEG
eukprot:6189402-Prymnesium_polylepis.1